MSDQTHYPLMRSATGLVRAWSQFDAFIYACFSINLITLGLYTFSQMYYLEGGLLPTLLVSAVFILAEVIVYAGLISTIPRAGGDYVWQSRVLGGGVAFVLTVTGWWFILWLWVPLYGDMLRHTILTPLLGLLGAGPLALLLGQTPGGLFLSSLAVCLFVTFFITVGMRWYAIIQRICFWGGMVALLAVFVILAFGTPDTFRAGLEREAPLLFGAPAGAVYEATVAAGQAAGAVAPLVGQWSGAIFLSLPLLVFFNLWPTWGAPLYGEVRHAQHFKHTLLGMAGALGLTTTLAVVFLLLINRTFGWDFYMQANAAWWHYAYGATTEVPPLPIWPYPILLTVFMVPNHAVQVAIVTGMSLWWVGWAGTVFLSSTRVVFAVAFDGLLPDRIAEIDVHTRTPIYAVFLMVLPAVLISALYAWDIFGFKSLTLDSTLVIAVTYLGSAITAILLPARRPDLYRASTIAKYQIGGIPLLVLAGFVMAGFLVFLLVLWLLDPLGLYGIGLANRNSILFILFLYALASCLYFVFRTQRQRQGISITQIHASIPVE